MEPLPFGGPTERARFSLAGAVFRIVGCSSMGGEGYPWSGTGGVTPMHDGSRSFTAEGHGGPRSGAEWRGGMGSAPLQTRSQSTRDWSVERNRITS